MLFVLILFLAQKQASADTFNGSQRRRLPDASPADVAAADQENGPVSLPREQGLCLSGPLPAVPGFHNRRFFGCNAAFGRRSDHWSLIVDLLSAGGHCLNGSGRGLPRLRSGRRSLRYCPVESFRPPSSVSARLSGCLSAGLRRLANRPLAADDAR